ncbi:MAG TPA: CBS domain-containing protein [Polyangiaceae bacterium]|nr:CBS domain-containing protein [Polyangiaceae bacterium]
MTNQGRDSRSALSRTASGANIEQLMLNKTQGVWTISPDASVFEAIYAMADHNVGALPVVTGDQVVGMISERDYARKLILSGKSSLNTAVREVMSTDVVTITEQSTVEECMRLMTTHRIRHLPVMREHQLVGIISIGDIVYDIIARQEQVINELTRYVAG